MIGGTLDIARAAFDDGDYNLALNHLNRLIQVGSGIDEPTAALLGETLFAIGLPIDAAEFFEHAAAQGSEHAFRHFARAAGIYAEAGQDGKAITCAVNAHRLDANDLDIVFLLLTLLNRTGQAQSAGPLKYRLIESDDQKHLDLALELIGADRWDENSLTLLKKLNQRNPQDSVLRNAVMCLAREFCDFDTLDTLDARLPPDALKRRADLLAQETPHDNIHWCADERVNALARNSQTIGAFDPRSASRRKALPRPAGDRIRIGYLSADFFSTHATMRLLNDVLRRHDRNRFDVTLFCHSPRHLIDTPEESARRLEWGTPLSIHDLTDAQAAETIRSHGIDILVDLKGHTANSRATILNHAAAPVQATWLGFPGSVIDIDIDYVISDRFVTQDTSKRFYHEKFCRLPDSYQPNDPVTRPLPPATSRADLGLPDNRFVFASFNAPLKLTRETVALWARILTATPNSVLWLMRHGPATEAHIVKRFSDLGVDPERLIFAMAAPYPQHIARLQAADLALDTFPCNGHTTTSDKLWSGLPVLTMKGSNFASRVSESLLNAINLPELVADSPQAYVDLAVALAGDPSRLAQFRSHLVAHRYAAPLFDTERFCRHLESGYEMMAARARDGLPAAHFDVPALPARLGTFNR